MSPSGRDTLQMLKTSFKYQAKQFVQNGTLHGINYIIEENRPFHERFLWFGFLVTGSATTFIIIASLWEKFQVSPTITGLDTDFHSWDVPFPAITLCPTDPTDHSRVDQYIAEYWGNITEEEFRYYKEFIVEIASLSIDTLKRVKKYRKNDNLPVNDLRKIFPQVVIRCKDFISECNFKGERIDCCDEFLPVLTEQGFCYSFNSRHFDVDLLSNLNETRVKPTRSLKYIYETDTKLHVSFLVNDKKQRSFAIYIHSSNETVGLDFPPQHVWNRRICKISFMPSATYTTQETKQLSIEQRHCIFEDEVTLITDDMYTFSACMTQCRMQIAFDKCGCIPFFYREVGNFKHCDLDGLICLTEHEGKTIRSSKCNCELGCTTTIYDVEKLDDARTEESNSLEITFVSWPMIRYKRDVLFGWVDLFVAFGGIAGLFLGFSLLSVVEIIYYLTIRTWCMVYTNPNEVKKIYERNKYSKKPEINLDMKPKFLKKKEPSTNTKMVRQRMKNDIYVLPYLP